MYYVFDDAKNLYEGWTKEQIVNAIAAATGLTPEQISADVLTSAIKEQNAQRSLKLWIGTQVEYNAITTPDADTLYCVLDPTREDELQAQIDTLQAQLDDMARGIVIFTGTGTAGNQITLQKPITDYEQVLVTCGSYVLNCVKTTEIVGGYIYYLGSLFLNFGGVEMLVDVTLATPNSGDGKTVTIESAHIRTNPFKTGEYTTNGTITQIRGN